jgi:phage replication O-like protein O
MAGPQLEDGYTRIANELMEEILRFGFSARELLVIFAIIRKTYGYGKKSDDISASQIGDACNIARQHVTSTLNSLAIRNVITKSSGRFGSVIGIQKNHTKWVSLERTKPIPTSPDSGQGCPEIGQWCPDSGHVPIQLHASPDLGQVDSPDSGHTKENLPKEIKQKKAPRQQVTFKKWLENCELADVQPIPEDDAVFSYAKDQGLSRDYIRFAWVEFKRKYRESNKRYKNWNQHFQNAVRENWYGIWFDKDGAWQLTTRGKQIEKEVRAKHGT